MRLDPITLTNIILLRWVEKCYVDFLGSNAIKLMISCSNERELTLRIRCSDSLSERQPVKLDDHSEVVPLLPIPNRTVKRLSADDSAGSRVKVGHCQAII